MAIIFVLIIISCEKSDCKISINTGTILHRVQENACSNTPMHLQPYRNSPSDVMIDDPSIVVFPRLRYAPPDGSIACRRMEKSSRSFCHSTVLTTIACRPDESDMD